MTLPDPAVVVVGWVVHGGPPDGLLFYNSPCSTFVRHDDQTVNVTTTRLTVNGPLSSPSQGKTCWPIHFAAKSTSAKSGSWPIYFAAKRAWDINGELANIPAAKKFCRYGMSTFAFSLPP